MPSLQSRLLLPLLNLQRSAQRTATIEGTRRMSKWSEDWSAMPPGVRREKFQHDRMGYEWLIPQDVHPHRVIFYIHGGGFVFPLYSPLKLTLARLARMAHARVLAFEYRLAPENPFPAALEDSVTAYRWLISDGGVVPEHIVFSGESAGGNLVITTLLSLRDSGDPLPAGAVPLCAPFDLADVMPLNRAIHDAMAHPNFWRLHREAYCGSADPRNPLISPVYANLRGLPPLFMQTGAHEMFRPHMEQLAARAQEAGVAATLEVWPGMWHYWHLFAPFLPEARHALDSISAFIQKVTP